jgi:choline dehydrogenase-like flavoprotein
MERYDFVVIGSGMGGLTAGEARFRDDLSAAFPEERRAIDTSLSDLHRVQDYVRLHAISRTMPGPSEPPLACSRDAVRDSPSRPPGSISRADSRPTAARPRRFAVGRLRAPAGAKPTDANPPPPDPE